MPLTDSQAVVDGAAKWRRRTMAGLIGANVAVAALLAALVALVLHRSHQAFAEQARNVADGIAAVAQLNIQGEFGRVDGVIRSTVSELERLRHGAGSVADATLNEVLGSRYGLLDGIEAIRLTDAAGHVRWGTGLPPGEPTSVSDRDYFKEAALLAEPRTIVEGPLISRVSGNWVVAFVRPIRVDGRFDGVLYVSIGTDHFSRMFERYVLGAGELKGQPARLVYWDDAQYERVGTEGYAALREHGHYRSHVRLRRKSGESVWVDFGAVPLTDLETFTMIVDVTATKLAHEDMVHAAFHDALTQLPNRLLLHDRIDQALATARRDGKSVAVCYLDLDGFKEVNDLHGHDAGDTLLQAVAHRLRSAIRPSDTAARVGGDEFVLVLGSVNGGDWRPILERVMASIGEPVVLAFEMAVSVAATAGVTVCHSDDVAGAQELVQRADHVMLRGKRIGKGGVFLH